MSRVNPPPHIKLPKKLAEDKETRTYFQQIEFILFQMWKRTGGGSDIIESIENTQTIESVANTGTQALSAISFYTAIKSSSYTAVNGDFIEAQKGAIITLDPEADIDDQIMIANGDGSKITVSGNIKYTKLDSSIIIRQQGTSLHFQNFGDYWRIR